MCPHPPPLPPPLLSGLSLRALCCCSCVLLGPDGVSHLSVNQETHRQTRSTGNVYVAAAFPSIAWRNSTIHHETMPAFSHRSAASPLMESDGPSRCTAATTATFGLGLVMVLRRRAPATPPWPGDTAPAHHCAKRRLRRAACWQPLPFNGSARLHHRLTAWSGRSGAVGAGRAWSLDHL